MKYLLACLLFVVGFIAGPLFAAEEKTDGDREALREEMRAAREELALAARKVAELSRELGEGFAFEFRSPHAPRRAMLSIVVDGKPGEGVKVLSVTPGGPADRAGLRGGDVITGIGETNLEDAERPAEALVEALDALEPGDEVELRYRRGNDEQETTVVPESFRSLFAPYLFDAPHPPAAPLAPRAPLFLELMRGWRDVELAPLSPELGEYFGTDKGLLVVRAPREADFKLRDGDVILAIGGREPEDAGHAIRILRSYQPGETVKLDILRKRERMTLEIEIPERRLGFGPKRHIEREVVRHTDREVVE